ncbi:MAG TPA: LysR family transcriptional regulator [Afifellaceae bacterium]|nr:LysR family transcriptional regulator [Afifellaceae bacterium]
METQHIPFVRAVAEHRTISAAARELGISQPALTKIILRVEDLVGARLFDRQPRGVALTPFGELFLQRMDRVEREMLNLRSEVESLKAGLSGTVTIGVGQFWIGQIVPRVIVRLLKDAPDVQVKVRTGTRDQLLVALQRGKIDLMLGRFGDDLPDEFQSEALAAVAIHLTVREGHPLADIDHSVSVQDVRPYSWILPPPADPTAVHLEQVFREVFHSELPAAVEAVSQNVIVALLQASDMITAMPGITVNPPPSGLRRLHADWLSWTRSAGVISVREQTPLPCCARFLDLLRKEMAPGD